MLVSGLSQVTKKEFGSIWLSWRLLTDGNGHNSESFTDKRYLFNKEVGSRHWGPTLDPRFEVSSHFRCLRNHNFWLYDWHEQISGFPEKDSKNQKKISCQTKLHNRFSSIDKCYILNATTFIIGLTQQCLHCPWTLCTNFVFGGIQIIHIATP